LLLHSGCQILEKLQACRRQPRDQNETVCAVVVKFHYNLKEAGTETKDGGERLRQMAPTMMEANEGNEDGDIHNFFSF
jgi:hypothetical protein